MHRHSFPGPLVLVALSLAAPAAFADVLTSTLGQPLREVSHTIDVKIADGVAVYTVRRVFSNSGNRADEAGLEIDLPYGAAATGLRIRARHRWYRGELYEAGEAARLYHEMTGFGAHAVKDPALLQWIWADKLYLQVFPVLPGSTSTVEYTLTVPTRYERGKVFLSYPHVAALTDEGSDESSEASSDLAARAPPLARPVLTVRPSWGDATTSVVIDGQRVAPDTPVVLSPPQTPAWLEGLGLQGASAVASAIVVPDVAASRGPFSSVTLTLDIEHTFKGDLRVALLTPSDAMVSVFNGEGGDNDVKGTFSVPLEKPEAGAGVWRLVVSDHAARDAGSLNLWTLALGKGSTSSSTDTPVFIPDAPESENDAGTAAIVLAPPPIETLTARLGKVVASKEHAFSRLEIDAAPELRALPKRSAVVFVIDASHSAGPEHIDAQIALVRAQLAPVPDARAEIVIVRRRATRLFGRFVPALEVPAALEAAKGSGALAPGNGSAIDEGMRLAVAALDDAGRGLQDGASVPLRVVAFTDEQLRSAFRNAWVLDALRAAPRRTVVHVVAPEVDHGDESRLRRDDDAALAPLAAEHHGIFARIDGLPAPDKRLAGVALGLVRPIQIDAFSVRGLSIGGGGEDDAQRDDDDGQCDDDGGVPSPALRGGVLHEGAGVRAMLALPAARAPEVVVLRGKIWGDPFSRRVMVDQKFSRATAAFVFGEDEHNDLSEAEQMTIALMGRAVSPVTSYLATEPGVRPSPIGLDRGAGGFGLLGAGAGGGGSAMGIGGVRRPPDLRALVDDGASVCLARHPVPPARGVTLEAETTMDEVVDVIAPAGRESEPLVACLVEAVWAVRLDESYNLPRERFRLSFP